jgi:hypothetical protein
MMNGRARKHQHTKLNLPSFKRLTQPTTQHLMDTGLWYLVIKNFIHFREITFGGITKLLISVQVS